MSFTKILCLLLLVSLLSLSFSLKIDETLNDFHNLEEIKGKHLAGRPAYFQENYSTPGIYNQNGRSNSGYSSNATSFSNSPYPTVRVNGQIVPVTKRVWHKHHSHDLKLKK
jgi:hypothetical protein